MTPLAKHKPLITEFLPSWKMTIDVSNRGFEIGQYLGAEADHPGRALGKTERAERDHELAEIVAGVKNFHRGADRRLAVIHQQQGGVQNVLQIELDDFICGIDLPVAEVAPQRIEQDESSRQPFLGARAPVLGRAIGFRIHDRTAEIDFSDPVSHGAAIYHSDESSASRIMAERSISHSKPISFKMAARAAF